MTIVALTGASGGIGRGLLERLAGRFHVRVLFRSESPAAAAAKEAGCDIVIGDLANEAALRMLVADAEIVFHCAAAVTHGLQHAREVNVEGTRRLAKLAAEAGCRRFVHFSSIAVYLASQPREQYDEGVVLTQSPRLDPYSRTKLQGEIAVREACKGTELAWTILRPTCVYGPGIDSWTMMPLNAIRKGMPIHLGRGDGMLNAVYVDDVAGAAIAAATCERAAGRIYNVGGEIVSTAEFLQCYSRLIGRKPKRMRPFGMNAVVGIGGAVGKVIPLPANADPRLLKLMAFCTNAPPGIDMFPSSRLANEVGFERQVTLGDGMFRTQRWLEREGHLKESKETLHQSMGNHTFTPRAVYRPATEAQLQEVVAEAVHQGRRVRMIGALHSISRVHASEDVCIALDEYRSSLRVEGNFVTVEAGMKLKHFCNHLAEHQLALPILGSVQEQTISGAIATGTHGGSLQQASITDSIVATRFIDGQGQIVELDRSNERFFGAVQSMGMCGVLSTLTFECVPAFSLRSKCWEISYDEMLAGFEQMQHEHDYVEFLWHPVLDRVEVFASDRIEQATSSNRELHAVRLGTTNPIGRRLSLWGFNKLHRNRRPRFHRRIVPGRIGKWYTEREGRSDYVLSYSPWDRRSSFPMDNYEFAVPYSRIVECIPHLRQQLKQARHYPVLGVRFRCQKASKHWLNAAYDRDVCWIETFNAHGAIEFRRFLHDTLSPFDYRPHWGKTLYMDREYLFRAYPMWNQFQTLRREMDPADLFLNEYLGEAFVR